MTHEARRELLLKDYSAARDDERAFYAAMGGTLSAAIALSGLSLTFLSTQGCLAWVATKNCKIDHSFLTLFPLVLVCLFAYQSWIALDATFRSFYMRALEEEIRRFLRPTMRAIRSNEIEFEITSFATYQATAHSQSRMDRPVSHMIAIIWSVTAVLVLAVNAVSWLQVDWAWRLVMLVVNLPIIGLVGWTGIVAASQGREYVRDIVQTSRIRRVRRASAIPGTRSHSPLAYFLIPGPDHLGTSLVTALGYFAPLIFGWSPTPSMSWGNFLIALALFELLLQQARYAFNDVRGYQDDGRHPLSRLRGRLGSLGISDRSAIILALVSIGWRLTIFATFATVGNLPISLLAVAFLALAIQTGGYEVLRSLRPARESSLAALAWITIAWVGVGYGIRWWFGWACVTGSVVPDERSSMIFLFASLLGSLGCCLTWEIEGGAYFYSQRDAVSDLSRTRCPQGATGVIDSSIGVKPHVSYLSKWSWPRGVSREESSSANLAAESMSRVRLLLLPMSLTSPHIYVMLSASSVALVAGTQGELWHILLLATISLIGILSITRLRMRQRLWISICAAEALISALWWMMHGWDSSAVGPLLLSLTWVAVGLFGRNCAEDIFGLPLRVTQAIDAALGWVARAVIGRSAYEVVISRRKSKVSGRESS